MKHRPAPLSVLALLLASSPFGTAVSVEPQLQAPLRTIYSREPRVCDQFLNLYSSFQGCDLKSDGCFDQKWTPPADSPIKRVPIKEVATNEYGYTTVHVADDHLRDQGLAVVYLNRFLGDRHPRLLETWKVNAGELAKVLQLSPGPLKYEKRSADKISVKEVPQDTNASEFEAVLAAGERLSVESRPVWSPVFLSHNTAYVAQRECAGNWEYGGIYSCDKVIKVTIMRIEATNEALPVCEYSAPLERR